MAYQIDRYNNTPLTIIEDGTLDQSTDLKLVGKNYAGYGEIQNENFVYLLENFSGANPPPKSISGQIWFDSGSSKLKFYDGTKFRTTGGAEVAATAPTGLTIGDFWWDTENEQLYAQGNAGYVLVGPQGGAGALTQMTTKQIRDDVGVTHLAIVAYVDNEPTMVISSDDAYVIDPDDQETDLIPNFGRIKKGITLAGTNNANGVTANAGVDTAHVIWGTASDALRLGGRLAADYITVDAPNFTTTARFADSGLTVGDSNDLIIKIENDNQGLIQNQIGNSNLIKFKANNATGTAVHSTTITSVGVAPGATSAFDVGTNSLRWRTMYADTFNGVATKSAAIEYSSVTYNPDISAIANTVPLRDASGDITANNFQGIASSAKYADLAEKYATDMEYPVGTIMTIGGTAESKACNKEEIVCGVISENPAYLMNADANGQALALKGRVPVRVAGAVTKGQIIRVSQDGIGSTMGAGDFVGLALESSDDTAEKLVECFLKV